MKKALKNIPPTFANPIHQSTDKKLPKGHRQAIGLIQIGTFLEYFDLYLYIHMAVVLNLIFFPKTDPYTASLLSAFTFSSTFLLRPFGALFFGYIGDYISRKASVIVTTLVMAACSFVIASTPSYETIGISASIIMIVCRLLQGFSSVGEIPGARIYITEITKEPAAYFYTTLVNFFAELGAFVALLMGAFFLFINSQDGWRTAFYFGSGIAVIGSIARTQLRETTEFAQEITQEEEREYVPFAQKIKNTYKVFTTHRKTFLCYLGLECIYPLCFYFSFIYLGDLLRTSYGFTPSQVIYNNLFVALVQVISTFIYAYWSLYYPPLVILRAREIGFFVFALCLPFFLRHSTTSMQIFLIQCVVGGILGGDSKPAHVLFIRSFPIIGRYTQTALAFALSRAFMYIITAYGCVVIGQKFGKEGLSLGLAAFGGVALLCAFLFNPSTSENKS